MKKQLILAVAMSMVSALSIAANDSASDANADATSPKGSYDSTPPATGDKGLGSYNGSTGEKAPAAGAGATGSSSTSSSGGAYDRNPSTSGSTSGAYGSSGSASGTTGDASVSGSATASVSGDMETFNRLDKNRDGMLSKAEARKDKALSKKFKDADSDNDGKISQSEYQTIAGGSAGAGVSGSSSGSDASGLQTDPTAGSENRGATDMGTGTSGGAKDPSGNNIR